MNVMVAFRKAGTKLMKKPHIPIVGRRTLALLGRSAPLKMSTLLGRLRAASRRGFGHALSLARIGKKRRSMRFEWKREPRCLPPRSRPGWLVIAVKWLAHSDRRHPVKIHIVNRK